MVDLTKLSIGTRLKTRDGRSSRLLATDLNHPAYPVAAAVDDDGVERPRSYTAKGRYLIGEVTANDIVSVEEPA